MVSRLDDIRLRRTGAYIGSGKFDPAGAEQHYAEAFRTYGIDVGGPGAAARLRASGIREALLAGLDNWMRVKPQAERAALRVLADTAADNPWRRSCRAALLAGNYKKLRELAALPEALGQPPGILVWLGDALGDAGRVDEAVELLRRTQQRHPGDFWINFQLGSRLLWDVRPPRPAEAAGFFRIAVALRPTSAVSHSCLGAALADCKETDAAIVECRQAIELDSQFAIAHNNLGYALAKQDKLDPAIAAYRAAIELDPSFAHVHNNLGDAYGRQGNQDKAIAEYRQALHLDPKSATALTNLCKSELRRFRAEAAKLLGLPVGEAAPKKSKP
jgi:tetratricopeptide (TPR) repeat protein